MAMLQNQRPQHFRIFGHGWPWSNAWPHQGDRPDQLRRLAKTLAKTTLSKIPGHGHRRRGNAVGLTMQSSNQFTRPGKRLHSFGKSPFFIGKSTISMGHFQ